MDDPGLETVNNDQKISPFSVICDTLTLANNSFHEYKNLAI